MKKVIFSIVFALGLAGVANAQVSANAIGLRFGGGNTEISFQHALSDANRIEADLGFWYGGGFSLNGVYQWTFDLSALAPGFNWYVGPGAALSVFDSNINVGIGGQIGIEYNFEIPIQLSLDYRPTFYLLDNWGFVSNDVALSIRYRF